MITLLTLVPIIGGLAVLALRRTGDMARLMAMVFAAASFVFALLFWAGLDPRNPGMQFEERHAWAPSLGISYHVGMDGLGVLLVVLSALGRSIAGLCCCWKRACLGHSRRSTSFTGLFFGS